MRPWGGAAPPIRQYLGKQLYYRIYTCKIAKYRVYWLSNLLINSWRAVFYEKSYIQGCRQACRRIPNNRFLCNEQYPQCVFIRRDPKKSAGRSKSTSVYSKFLCQRLKTSQSKLLGVFLPTMDNPYYPMLMQYIEKYTARLGYSVILCCTYRNPEREKAYLDLCEEKHMDGVIYLFTPIG